MSGLSAVSKTAVLTLRARADEHRRADHLFADPIAVDWSGKLPWPRELDRWYTPFSQAKTALRAHQFDGIVRTLAADGVDTTVIELGGGFSTRAERLALPHLHWIVLDLPPVIAARAELGEHTRTIAGSALDPAWIAEVKALGRRVVVLAEGLVYYLPRAEVDALFAAMRAALPGAPLVLDVIGALDLSRSVAVSTQVGAPILWAVEPPFEAAQAALGLEVIEGLEPERVLAETVAGFDRRYGPLLGFALTSVTRLGFLRERRSGIMVGRLR